MKSFLYYTAKSILAKYGTDLSHIAIVFPNKRAALFLNEELAKQAQRPVWAPNYLTISELFRKHSQLTVGDPIRLVCLLYKCYISLTGKDEPLDEFYEWGKILISDFDDIDKNMADAEKVFANIANIHELDDVSYLNAEQKEVLKSFFVNFSDNHNTRIKQLFLDLWSKLGSIYKSFKNVLKKNGIAYEGMLYRDVIDNKSIKPEYDTYIFVGFNVLQKVEQSVFTTMKEASKAEFYWDFDFYYMPKPNGKTMKDAGKYISKYIKMFGDSLKVDRDKAYNNFSCEKSITYVKTKTNDIQARFVSDWLLANDRYKDGKRTAVIMCDEGLLKSIIHCIPEDVNNINITTGYPLAQTPLASFVSQLLDLRTIGRRPNGFSIKYVRKLLAHPYTSLISENATLLYNKIKEDMIVFPTPSDLAVDERLEFLFSSPQSNHDVLKWLNTLLKHIAPLKDSQIFQEAVFNMYTIVNRLDAMTVCGELDVDMVTLQKLIKQLIASTSIPFHGEPAIGVQIMGVLETRNLDFDHIVVLSCNEGNMPKGIRESSFIPYSIRKAYQLTTVDNKVAIYSYYFYRMIQRAKDVTILYNTSTENGNHSEMSRFMLQLMTESGKPIARASLDAQQGTIDRQAMEARKDDNVMHKLYTIEKLSPSAINVYFSCPMKFYYKYVAGIKEPDEDIEDALSDRAFGNVFHGAAEELYKQYEASGRMVTKSALETIGRPAHLAMLVDKMFQKELFGEDPSRWRKINYNGLQRISREVLVKYLQRLIEIDKEAAPFSVLALEKPFYKFVKIDNGERQWKQCIGGYVDRLDTLVDKETGKQVIRVIDYKAGRTDISSPVNTIEDIFDRDKANHRQHNDYYIQSMLYSEIIRNSDKHNPHSFAVSPCLLFIQKAFKKDYDPTIRVGKDKIRDINDYSEVFNHYLQSLVNEIYDKNIPFTYSRQTDNCQYCPYKGLCNKKSAGD